MPVSNKKGKCLFGRCDKVVVKLHTAFSHELRLFEREWTRGSGYFLVDDYFTVFFDALGSLYPNGVKELC